MGEPAALRRGDRVRAVGNPQGSAWSVNVTPDAVATVGDTVVTFESRFVGPGHSGGALLDDDWQVVGLLQSVEPPTATALRIDVVADRLRAWGHPVQLRPRFTDASAETVTAGAGFTCAVGAEGRLACWGFNDHGELGTGTVRNAAVPTPVQGGLGRQRGRRVGRWRRGQAAGPDSGPGRPAVRVGVGGDEPRLRRDHRRRGVLLGGQPARSARRRLDGAA
jgi:hypothetical protein